MSPKNEAGPLGGKRAYFEGCRTPRGEEGICCSGVC